jgi:hypothetical protein
VQNANGWIPVRGHSENDHEHSSANSRSDIGSAWRQGTHDWYYGQETVPLTGPQKLDASGSGGIMRALTISGIVGFAL